MPSASSGERRSWAHPSETSGHTTACMHKQCRLPETVIGLQKHQRKGLAELESCVWLFMLCMVAFCFMFVGCQSKLPCQESSTDGKMPSMHSWHCRSPSPDIARTAHVSSVLLICHAGSLRMLWIVSGASTLVW